MSICVCFLMLVACALAERPPHIVFILADDLGWNDVGFHGSNQIPTPNIDALAYSGLILQNYYVSPICTPSRSALMTGKHPVHTGMQHGVLYGADRRGLPLNETLLPEYLKRLGYVNRIVGKWHLGSYKKEYTPTFRGFDSHLGGWTGHMDYNDHTAMETGFWGLDIRRNMDVAYDLHGRYATDLFTDEAVRLINNHDKTKPLFLYLAHNAVHSGNPYNPLPGPDDVVARFDNITVYNRRRFAGMLSKLDESVGKVIQALDRRGILNDTIIVFSTDNGGPAEGFNINAASNYPLRGVKNTLWEGGVRGAAFLWSPRIRKPKRVALQMMHVADWLPTLFSAAGGNKLELQGSDGEDLWTVLSNDEAYVRKSLLHNIDDIAKVSAIRVGDWKLLKGTTYDGVWDKWYGPSGREGTYDFALVTNSPVGLALKKLNIAANRTEMQIARNQATITCFKPLKVVECKPLLQTCLFNIAEDPCEYNNLAEKYPEIVQRLIGELANWNRTAVPPGNLPIDPRGDPKYWNNVFTNFGDYIEEAKNILTV